MGKHMRLSQLLAKSNLPFNVHHDPQISGITADSRSVEPGNLFVAIPGTRMDGRNYIDEALSRGAVAILSSPDTPSPQRPNLNFERVHHPDPRLALSLLAAAFYGQRPQFIAAVTGTNGKTSVASFCQYIWAYNNFPSASLGTLGLKQSHADPITESPDPRTTPDPVCLHRCLLATLAHGGTQHLVLEASSHGLHQKRLDGVPIAAAAFTNLTQDHLDYHSTMAAYLEAKLVLFGRLLQPNGTAVINAESPYCTKVVDTAKKERNRTIWLYGKSPQADLRLVSHKPNATGQTLELDIFGEMHTLNLPLVGYFQALNALAALGLAHAGGIPIEQALEALGQHPGVPGRLQQVATTPHGASVFIDYAHTPDALETVLATLRPHTKGRLHLVMGCGGDRDKGKRPLMGEIATRLADHIIITDDNPRTENPAAIRREILAATPHGLDIGDRGEAIAKAISLLAPDDCLLIAGKGHETGQIVRETIHPFNDANVVQEVLASFKT